VPGASAVAEHEGEVVDGSYHIIVRLEPTPGHQAALQEALRDLAEASRATSFCERFVVTRSLDPPGDFWLFERFSSKEAYDAHVATPHAQRFLDETLPAHVATRDVLVVPTDHEAKDHR
jgi:quinol monooxygenase YgiN